MLDSRIGGDKYPRRHPPSSIVDNVFDCGGAPSLSDRGRPHRGIVVSLPLSSSRGGAPLDPDGDDNEHDDYHYPMIAQ